MKTLYETPATRVLEVKLRGNMMLLNSDGTTGNASIDSLTENEDYKNTIWQ